PAICFNETIFCDRLTPGSLKQSMAARIEPLLTIADLDSMPEDGNRYELIEGELFVSRAPSLTHQQIVFRFLLALGNHLEKNPIGKVWPGPGVIFSDFSGVIPDIIYKQ